ncbi:MAG: chemotaxis protein CheB [Gammaproteobacteria bacterium]|nr:chemotaxis protein CheB [Gammaproteobacteria bacterium]MDH5799548.1 chemotaxis protein CheB [Gammaproteobacteria bacterium]
MQSTKVAVFASSNRQRQHLQTLLEKSDKHIQVVLSEAESGTFLEKIADTDADVVLIDFGDDDEQVDDVLDVMMDQSDIPVLFNDSGTEGATGSDAWARKLAAKLVAMAHGQTISNPSETQETPVNQNQDLTPASELNVWVLGASLGGPQAVRQFLSSIDDDLPVVFILAQHIGANHINLLAEQLNRVTGFTVLPGKNGHKLSHGQVILTPADKLISFTSDGYIALKPAPPAAVYSPSIDLVMAEVARCFKQNAGTIVFSGMGDDGSKGCEAVAEHGGIVWAQDVASCVVSSMPDKARKTGKVSLSARPDQLAEKLYEHFSMIH